jgi:NADH dehydrogenase
LNLREGDQTPSPVGDEPHVVIVGAGFGGLTCAKALGRSRVRVTIVDQHNYHLFTPLLYQVATAALSPADITAPIRQVLTSFRNIETVLGEVIGVDSDKKTVLLSQGGFIPYDVLILATGSTDDYFGNKAWASYAPGVKTLQNARLIRSDLLRAFERAEATEDPVRRAELLTMVVVGGGPTGVEMAGTIKELARYTLAKDFRRIDPTTARVILIEAGPTLLGSFPEPLQRYAAAALRNMGVEVRLNTKVEALGDGFVTAAGQTVSCGNAIWGAGARASGGGGWLGVKTDKHGRIEVAPDLSVPGRRRIFALGDLTSFQQDGRPLPALAQVAAQQGRHLATQLRTTTIDLKAEDALSLQPFRYSSRGDTAVIGRSAAVFVLGKLRLRGRSAWVLWGVVHIYLLIGFGRPLSVALQWVARYLTSERGARLID